MNKLILYFMVILTLALTALAFTIEAPAETIYTTNEVPLLITSNETLDSLSYQINNDNEVICNNCSMINETLNLTEGNYSLYVESMKGNLTQNQTVEFEIALNNTPVNNTPDNETNETVDFSLEILSPIAKEYNTTNVSLEILSNRTLEQIEYKLDSDNFTVLCTNCSSYSGTLVLSQGDYELTAKGILQDIEKTVNVDFSVDLPENDDTNETDSDENETNDNETEPRFTLGFNKLPQALENGEITDAQLEEIIRNNKLNPGIINRLIKTGKLNQDSIDAILETQFNPPGIFRKLLGFFGFKQKSYSQLIYENYNVTEKTNQKLLMREDLPKNYGQEIKTKLQEKFQNKVEATEDSEPKDKKPNKTFNVGKQNGKNKIKSNNGKAKGKNK